MTASASSSLFKLKIVYCLLLISITCCRVVQADLFGSSSSSSWTRRSSNNDSSDPLRASPPENRDSGSINDLLLDYTTLAGKLTPIFSKFFLSHDELVEIYKFLQTKIHVEDMLFMAVVGWLTVPFFNMMYHLRMGIPLPSFNNKNQSLRSKKTFYEEVELLQQQQQQETLDNVHGPLLFRDTHMFLVSDHIQQIARIALAVYFVDMIKLCLVEMGFEAWRMSKFPHAFAQLAYLVWGAQRLAISKKQMLQNYVTKHPGTYGRVMVTNRLLNAAIIAAAGFFVLNILKVEMGIALGSFLAVGSIGTLALGLASQGIAAQVLNGLMLASSDRIYEGDTVSFGNGLSGTILSLGWLETILRGPDEVVVSIPNTDLVKQQVSNLSRVRFSQVKQVLKFRYADADQLPEVIQSIRNKIYEQCPSLISDGTRPFRVFWSDYGDESLEVTVDAHFRLKILGDDYHENRQRVLGAIYHAVTSHGIRFAQEYTQV